MLLPDVIRVLTRSSTQIPFPTPSRTSRTNPVPDVVITQKKIRNFDPPARVSRAPLG
jgi:hypothetical protein